MWAIVEATASVITIIGLPYLVISYRRRAPRFSFTFHGGSRRTFERDQHNFCEFTFSGAIRNQSLDPNSIERIYLVVWKTKRKQGVRTYGFYSPTVTEDGQTLQLPLRFDARQARTLKVVFEIVIEGENAQLATATVPFPTAQSATLLPKYVFELAFEDVIGNFFDQDGILRNRRGIDRRWTLENTFRQLKDGHPWPFVRHVVGIGLGDFVFFFRRNLRRLGI